MSDEQDIARELLLLAGEITDCSEKLSGLRERIIKLTNIPEYTKIEVVDLTKDMKRVQLEYAQAVNLLYSKVNP